MVLTLIAFGGAAFLVWLDTITPGNHGFAIVGFIWFFVWAAIIKARRRAAMSPEARATDDLKEEIRSLRRDVRRYRH